VGNKEEILKSFENLGTTEISAVREKTAIKPTQDNYKFELIATNALQKELGCILTHEKISINGFVKDFDMVNIDKCIVADAKNYTWTDSGNTPSAKISTLNEYVWLFQSLEKYQKRKWRKILVMGEKSFAEWYSKKHDPLLGDVEIYYCDQDGVLVKIR